MLTEADIIRIMTENYGAAINGTGGSLVEELINHVLDDAFDDGDPYEPSCYDMSKISDHTA